MAKTMERMVETMKFRVLRFETPKRSGPVVVSGTAAQEEMPPCIVDRPRGTGDRLLMFFPRPVRLRAGGNEFVSSGPVLRLWRDGDGHFYGDPERKWLHSWIHFHGEQIPALLARAGLEEEFCLEWHDGDLLESYFALVYREITGVAEPDARLLEHHLASLFLEIARGRQSARRPQIPEEWLEVRRFLGSNPEKPLDIKRLAKMVNRSGPAFAANFRKYFGISPIRCQLDCRMELARHLLRGSSLSVKEIGERCGYRDPFQFSRMFRRRTGQSPSGWRAGYER